MGLVRSNAHGIVKRQFGAPEVLAYASAPVPAPGPDEVRIRTIVAAINHTDLEAEIRRSLLPTSSVLPGSAARDGAGICGVAPGSTEAPPQRIPRNAAQPSEQEAR